MPRLRALVISEKVVWPSRNNRIDVAKMCSALSVCLDKALGGSPANVRDEKSYIRWALQDRHHAEDARSNFHGEEHHQNLNTKADRPALSPEYLTDWGIGRHQTRTATWISTGTVSNQHPAIGTKNRSPVTLWKINPAHWSSFVLSVLISILIIKASGTVRKRRRTPLSQRAPTHSVAQEIASRQFLFRKWSTAIAFELRRHFPSSGHQTTPLRAPGVGARSGTSLSRSLLSALSHGQTHDIRRDQGITI